MMKTKKIPISLGIVAIVTLGFIQIAAMHYGINGTFRALIAFLIAGILGIAIPTPKILKR